MSRLSGSSGFIVQGDDQNDYGSQIQSCRRNAPHKSMYTIVFGLLLNTPALAAAESEMTQEYVTCMDKSGGVTGEMIDCMSAERARQDARLNENYKRLMSKLSAKRKKELLEAQRAWIKFRDANCSFYHDPEGGTAALLARHDCFLQSTADRAKELRNLTPDE
jgi:uncharacterized protein YecT (DUF1311 family)